MTVLQLAASAPAAHAATPIVPTGSGLSEPAGVAVTPDGEIWVSDAVEGLCQVSKDPDAATGSRLVHDRAGYCAPEVHVAEGEPVPGPARPSATFQIAFDAAGCEIDPPTTDPSKCNFYVAEGTSGSSGVWRMHWNPETGEIDNAVKIYSALGDNRVFGLAVSPEGHVDFSSKRDNIIRRLRNPGVVPFFLTAEAIGFSTVEGAPSLAHLGQALMLADGGKVTRIGAPGPAGGTAAEIPGLPTGAMVSAVAADLEQGRVYAGTSSGKLLDSVLAVSAGSFVTEPYDGAFANVTALAVTPDGTLLAAHDALSALTPGVPAVGAAELFSTPLGPLDAPRVTFTATPKPAQRSDVTLESRTFRFAASRSGGSLSCRLDEGDVTPCGTGEGEFVVPAAALVEGPHSFEVWAGSGPPTKWFFIIDDTNPDVAIDEPTSHTAVGGALRVHFSSSESGVSFECSLDGGDPAPCNSARDLGGLSLGEHIFAVQATDAAGNPSEIAEWSFTAVPAPPASAGSGSAAPPSDGGQSGGPATIRVLVASRAPRAESPVPCVEVSPPRGRAAFSLRARRVSVVFRAPAQARYAKLTLRRSSGPRARARIVETLGYAAVRAPGSRLTARISLTEGQRRAVKAGRMGLAIAYGTCRTQVGKWEWLLTTNREGSQR